MSTTGSFDATPLFPRQTASAPALLAPAPHEWPARILLCADDSPSSGDAIAAAQALAARYKARVEVLSVFAPRIPLPDVPGRRGADRCEQRDRVAAAELIRAVRLQERRRFDGHVQWPVQLEVGYPAQAIVDTAKRTGADLVVLGLGERDPVLRQGGIATSTLVSRYVQTPMFAAASLMTALPQTAVLFVDREEPDPMLIRCALRCIEESAIIWVLIHTATTATRGDGVRHQKGIVSEILRVVRREAAAVSKRIVVRAVCRAGDPTEALLTIAREVEADLLALTVHGTAGTVRAFVPNIADLVLLTAPCSVLVVPVA